MTRKRANGDGSIYQSGKGWVATLTVRLADGKRKRLSRRAPNRDVARAHLNAMRAENVEAAEPSTVTLKQLCDRWVEQADVAPSSQTVYKCAVKHLDDAGGHWRIQEFDPMRIDSLLLKLKERHNGGGIGIRRICVTVLSGVLRYAKELKILTKEEHLELSEKLVKPKGERKRITPFTYEEAMLILAAAADERLRGVIVIAFLLGLRQGEIFGLRWRDIDFKSGTVSVAQQATVHQGEVQLRRPKTDAGFRSLPMPDMVREVLQERREAARVEGFPSLDSLVFPSEDGKPLRRSEFVLVWARVLKKAQVQARGLHHARHTCATLLLDQGTALQVVSSILGHSSPMVTLTLYGHRLPRADKTAISSLENRLGGSAVAAPNDSRKQKHSG